MIDKYVGFHAVPYYSQKNEFLSQEGSLKQSQINDWGSNLCGLMCACMIINKFNTGTTHTVAELLNSADRLGAFHQRRGWIHKKLMDLVGEYGIKGATQTIDNLDTLYSLLENEELIMASVSPNYLHPELKGNVNERSGHLVVIIGMNLDKTGSYQISIHDPGTEVTNGGKNLSIYEAIFKQSFSGNIIAFKNPKLIRKI